MHVLVYFDDRIRETCLRQAWSYANVQSLDSFELTESQLKADVLIIDVHQENISDISELVERVRAHSQMNVIALFATEQSISKQWSRYLISQSVFLLQANQIDHQTIQSLQSLLSSSHDREKSIASKTVLFTGTTPNIGSTVVAFGTALQLATRTDKSLAYICLNLKSSKIHHYIGIEHPSMTLDQIRAELKTASLTAEHVQQMLRPVKGVPNLHLLFGNQHREQAEFFTPEDIRHLLATIGQAYDGCLIDVNAYWDNAATITAALDANLKFVMTRNQRACFQEDLRKWLLTGCSMVELSPQSFDLFVTEHFETGYSLKDIRKETEMNVIGKMKHYRELDTYLNQGELLDFFNMESQAFRELEPLSQLIQTTFGWSEKPRIHAKNRWLSKIWPATHL